MAECAPRYQFTGMAHVATAFFLLNVLLFFLFLLVTTVRYVLFPWVLWRMLSHPAQYAPNLGVQLPAFASLQLLCSCWSQLCAYFVTPESSHASFNHPVQCKPNPPCVMLTADVCSAWLMCSALQRFFSGSTSEGLHVHDMHANFCVVTP